jgi:hypothetical protein
LASCTGNGFHRNQDHNGQPRRPDGVGCVELDHRLQIDVLNQPWVIGNSIRGNLDVVLSSGAAQIEGTVVDARSQPVPSLQAVLIPDQDRSRTELIKSAVTDQNGRFTLRGVSPGNYKIFAWEGLESNAYFDPEVLRQYEQQGKAVRVGEGEKITAEVKMIPAKPQ